MTPVEIVNQLLSNPLDIANVRSLTTPDVNYVSLNKNHPGLTRVLPWAGDHRGPEEIVKAFQGIYTMWEPVGFEVKAAFSQGEDVAVFGEFAYRSKEVGKTRLLALRHPSEGRGREDRLRVVPRRHADDHFQRSNRRPGALQVARQRSEVDGVNQARRLSRRAALQCGQRRRFCFRSTRSPGRLD